MAFSEDQLMMMAEGRALSLRRHRPEVSGAARCHARVAKLSRKRRQNRVVCRDARVHGLRVHLHVTACKRSHVSAGLVLAAAGRAP